MEHESIAIRRAEPTIADGLAFGRFVDEVTEGGFRFVLGRQITEILARAFLEPDNDFSYENVLFAVHDRTIVGMVSGYAVSEEFRPVDQPLALAPGCRLRRRVAMAILRARWRMMGYPDPGEFYIEFLITDMAFRNRGIGAQLMDAMEEQARVAGLSRFSLDVAAKNTGGRRFYERRGMEQVPGFPRGRMARRYVLRMRKELG